MTGCKRGNGEWEYFIYGLQQNSEFRNIESGTEFRVTCDDYEDIADFGATHGENIYSIFNLLDEEESLYTL
jgi:hypothetical protein